MTMEKDKLLKMAACTGAKETEVKNLTSAGFISVCAVVLASIFGAGCAHHEAKTVPAQDQSKQAQAPQNTQQKLPDLNKGNGGGPWPGYPAGTKYHTVSMRDFEERIA